MSSTLEHTQAVQFLIDFLQPAWRSASHCLVYISHTRDHDNVTFVDKKSEKLHEKIVNLRVERSQPTFSVPQSVDENKLYYDVVGGEMHLAPRTLFVASGNLVLLLI
ncbi:hypothetical protein POM88_023348 [Heracleum sosnowskyi]|uniref:Uncharacterized protein n=1 Tax=Heracleum sosnowskyi TaxID=360622 RepID=A0AAD8II45_9APIA|nr:hypothetical protein POM88_023348 [Heracleum sosnowskyi]